MFKSILESSLLTAEPILECINTTIALELFELGLDVALKLKERFSSLIIDARQLKTVLT